MVLPRASFSCLAGGENETNTGSEGTQQVDRSPSSGNPHRSLDVGIPRLYVGGILEAQGHLPVPVS